MLIICFPTNRCKLLVVGFYIPTVQPWQPSLKICEFIPTHAMVF